MAEPVLLEQALPVPSAALTIQPMVVLNRRPKWLMGAQPELRPLATPHMWERLFPDCSAWLTGTIQRQQSVEEHYYEGNIEELMNEHSSRSKDLCKFEGFLSVTRVLHVQAELSANQSKAAEVRADAERRAAMVQSTVDKSVEEWRKQDQQQIAVALSSLRDEALQKVRQSRDLLGEITDLDRGISRRSVLSAAYGAGAVDRMSPDEMKRQYELLRADRIRELETASREAAQNMIDCSIHALPIDEILEQEASADDLRSSVKLVEVQYEMGRSNVAKLHQEYEITTQQQKACQEERKRRSARLERSRKSLKLAWKALQEAELEYQDANIEDLSLKLQSTLLGKQVEATKKEIELAQTAEIQAEITFNECLLVSRSKEEIIRELILHGAKQVVAGAAKNLEIVGLNVQVAITLLTRLLQSREKEMEMLLSDRGEAHRRLQYLKEQNAAKDHGYRIVEVQTKCAEIIDELDDFASQIESCHLNQQRIQQLLQLAKAQYGRIESLDKYYKFLPERGLDEHAQDLVSQSYPETDAGAYQISIHSVNITQLTAKIEKEIRTKLTEQMMADKLFRNPEGSNDCGKATMLGVSDKKQHSPFAVPHPIVVLVIVWMLAWVVIYSK